MTILALPTTKGGVGLFSSGFVAFVVTALPVDVTGPTIRRALPHVHMFAIVTAGVAAALTLDLTPGRARYSCCLGRCGALSDVDSRIHRPGPPHVRSQQTDPFQPCVAWPRQCDCRDLKVLAGRGFHLDRGAA